MLDPMVMIQTGRVVDGKVVVDDDAPLPEGAVVGIVLRGDDQRFELTPEQEERIARALEQIERGEGISAEDFWAKVRRSR
jgi:hypothetical protein